MSARTVSPEAEAPIKLKEQYKEQLYYWNNTFRPVAFVILQIHKFIYRTFCLITEYVVYQCKK